MCQDWVEEVSKRAPVNDMREGTFEQLDYYTLEYGSQHDHVHARGDFDALSSLSMGWHLPTTC